MVDPSPRRAGALILLASLCAPTAAQKATDHTPRIILPPRVEGTWHSNDWGNVELKAETGSYDKPAAGERGTLRFARTGPKSISGSWRETERRGGTLVFTVADDGRIRGTWRVDGPDGRGARPRPFTWTRKGPVPAPPYRLEIVTDPKKLKAKLNGAVRVVGFDDIDTSKVMPAAFKADHYESGFGIVIEGDAGQYVDRAFNYPTQFIAHSKPNMYAPGPLPKTHKDHPRGGIRTRVRFSVRKRRAAVAGFGSWFHDVDNARIAASWLVFLDARGQELGTLAGMSTPNGGKCFRGVVAVSPNGAPLPLIARIRIHTGNGWPGMPDGEGVSMDDYTFGIPVLLPPAAKRPESRPRKSHRGVDRRKQDP
ncbi:MAG: hypothetical protein ACYTKC_17205 [Planctomycetota bacterium]|jgi:hypothetical protein